MCVCEGCEVEHAVEEGDPDVLLAVVGGYLCWGEVHYAPGHGEKDTIVIVGKALILDNEGYRFESFLINLHRPGFNLCIEFVPPTLSFVVLLLYPFPPLLAPFLFIELSCLCTTSYLQTLKKWTRRMLWYECM